MTSSWFGKFSSFKTFNCFFTKKIENPCRAPKVVILTSRGQPGAGMDGTGGQLPPCHPPSAAHGANHNKL